MIWEREHIIIYTKDVGGKFYEIHGYSSKEMFDEAVRTGRLCTNPAADEPEYVEPKFIALCNIEDDFDFDLGRSRWGVNSA